MATNSATLSRDQVESLLREAYGENIPDDVRQQYLPVEEPPPAPSQPSLVRMTIGGVEFVGENQRDIEQQVNRYLEAQAQQVRNAPAKAANEEEKKVKTTPDWVNRFTSDPKAVLEEELNQFLEQKMTEKFGTPQWAEAQKVAISAAYQRELEKTGQRFLEMNPDYEANQDNVGALEAIMKQEGLPMNAHALTSAWQMAKQRGIAKPKQAEAPRAPAPGPIPVVPKGGSSAPSTSIEDLISNETNPERVLQMLKSYEQMQGRTA